jgi:single-stranded DNA-binding protein
MQIMVVGEVETRPYLDNSGQPAATLELTAQNFQFLGQRGDGQGGGNGGYDDYAGGGNQGGSNVDDIPF